ncbi:MAG: zinc metalloprotease HtpX [Candidatus Nitrosocaldus sp.]
MQRYAWKKRDIGITMRLVICFAVLSLLYLIFLSVLAYVGVGMVPLIFLGVFFMMMQYLLSDRIVLWSTGTKIVSEHEYPRLHAIVDRLVVRAGLPKPRVAVMHTDVPNAFATGKGRRSSVVAVTTGLMRILNDEELEGVIAHELAHIKNRDVLAITLASIFSTIAWYVMHYGWYGAYGYRSRDQAGGLILAIIIAAITWFVSFLMIRAISRYREYIADRDGALLTGKPSKLASALMKISGIMSRIPSRDLREVEAMNTFFIIPALSGDTFSRLFSTHPPVEERIRRLMEMEASMH